MQVQSNAAKKTLWLTGWIIQLHQMCIFTIADLFLSFLALSLLVKEKEKEKEKKSAWQKLVCVYICRVTFFSAKVEPYLRCPCWMNSKSSEVTFTRKIQSTARFTHLASCILHLTILGSFSSLFRVWIPLAHSSFVSQKKRERIKDIIIRQNHRNWQTSESNKAATNVTCASC